MAPKLKIYDADKVTATFFGFLIDSGLGEDEFIRITPEGPVVTDKAGADGEVVRSKTNEKRVTIKITLLQTSEGNAKLSAIAELDDRAGNGAGVGPFLVKDRSGLSLHAGKAWISELPETVYAKGAEAREWTLRGVISGRFEGGTTGI